MRNDPQLLSEHVDMLVEAGEIAEAGAQLTEAIDRLREEDPTRAALLASRASVRATAGEVRSALDDLEAAFVADPDAYADALASQLGRARAAAEAAGDESEVRVIRLRLAQVLPFAGDVDGARAVLGELLRRDPKDRQALRTLAILEGALDRWEASSAAWRRLVSLEEGEAALEAAVAMAEACEKAGRPGDARGVLERAHLGSPEDRTIRDRLEHLYEVTGAWHELAELALADAHASGDVAARFTGLVRAGTLLVAHAGEPEAAVAALEEALALRPGDFDCVLPLADAYVESRRAREAQTLLEATLGAHKMRRTRELAPLHVRFARVARAVGDPGGETRALLQALECDAQNGDVCSEVAERAIDLDELDLATRSLRAITLLKAPGPMSKALAFQYLGEIARRQGDVRKALALLKRALTEDPSLDDARTLIDVIERGVEPR
jgi:tetratricopeptide (TPR) repeat protein